MGGGDDEGDTAIPAWFEFDPLVAEFPARLTSASAVSGCIEVTVNKY